MLARWVRVIRLCFLITAAEDAARRKRIEERLQASQGKAKPSANSKNPQASDGMKKGISEKRNPKYEELRRQNLKHVQKPTTEKEHRVSKVDRQGHRVSIAERQEHRMSKVEKSSDKMRGSQSSTAKKTSSKMDFKDLMKVAKGQADHKPELPVKKEYKQHRRKRGKEGDFEWSGALSTLESKAGDSVSQKAEKEYLSKAERSRETEGNGKGKLKTAKKAASTINFKDLLSVAKQQANKPTSVVQKKDIAIRKQAEGSQQAIAKRRDGGFGKHASKRSPEPQRKNRYVDINSVRVNNEVERSSKRPEKPMGVPKSGGCKLVTRTIDNKRNYELEGPRMSSGNAQQRNGGQGTYGNRNGMKRSKVESIDDELERERRELEKRRNMLKRKMQGIPQDEMSDFSEYSEDDYDEEDDMADFIDDGGEETDYSKHIRSIFGYDRRK